MFDYAAHGLYAPRRRPSIPGPVPQTVATVLDPVLRSDPDRLALVGRSGRLTYAQLDRVVRLNRPDGDGAERRLVQELLEPVGAGVRECEVAARAACAPTLRIAVERTQLNRH